MKKANWTYYSIELLVVFVGVTAGFILNAWRQESNKVELEQKYLASFNNDLSSDQTSLDTLIISSQTKVDTLLSVLNETIQNENQISEELAQKIVTVLIYIDWFSASNDTYEDIKNSGNLNLISNYSIKEKISSYYKFVNEIKNIERYYIDHMDKYGFPILYKNYHLYKRKFVNKKSYQSLEFSNMYLAMIALLQQNNATYKKALEKNKELKAELMNVLNIEE